eukprot:COSAG02_NODE_3237_length_7121_cov_16.614782_6_plen_146_part_00
MSQVSWTKLPARFIKDSVRSMLGVPLLAAVATNLPACVQNGFALHLLRFYCMTQVWADIGTDEDLVKSMEEGAVFNDLEKLFGKKVEKKEKSKKKKGPQTVKLLGECMSYRVQDMTNPSVRTTLCPLVVNHVSFLDVLYRLEALD